MVKKKSKASLPKWAKYLLVFALLCLLAAAIYENKKYVHRAFRYFTHRYIKTKVRPTDFPLGYSIHGIDISHYQKEVDWEKLKAIDQLGDTVQFRFAFIKATEGLLIEDAMFDEHWEDAKDHSIVRGAYHYFLPDRSPKIQAANFTSSVKLKKGDLPPVVDVEEKRGKTKKEIVKALKEFLPIIEKRYKVKPIIYSNLNFIEDYLADDFKEYPFWIAHYYQAEMTPIDSLRFLFWQHSDKSDLLGVNGNTDANIFTGSEKEFQKFLLK
ncbi:MAG: GH25 family lysozyme [Bacteroidota bacterium]